MTVCMYVYVEREGGTHEHKSRTLEANMFGSHRNINHIGVLPEDPQRHPQRIGGGHFVEIVDDLPDDSGSEGRILLDDGLHTEDDVVAAVATQEVQQHQHHRVGDLRIPRGALVDGLNEQALVLLAVLQLGLLRADDLPLQQGHHLLDVARTHEVDGQL